MKNPVKLVIYSLDYILRKTYGIKPFVVDPNCILRLSFWKARAPFKIAEGLEVEKGELVGELHLWNEQIPLIPPAGPDLRWGYEVAKRLHYSLGLLAQAIENGLPEAEEVKVLGGEIALPRDKSKQIEMLLQHLGLILDSEKPAGFWSKFAQFWQNLYSMALIWAYNPVSLRKKSLFRMRRYRVWMTKEELLKRYGKK
ncbi:MAG: hypothetical protein RMK30_04775 [Anaerolineae bacterium]|nr:hypothetical protein [Anaerolineae bacterium]MDW8102170.1 hypothetical protein [Anaerolineae bacterium]